MEDEASPPPAAVPAAADRGDGGKAAPWSALEVLEDALDRTGEHLRNVEDDLRGASRSRIMGVQYRQLPELAEAIQACIDTLYPGSPSST